MGNNQSQITEDDESVPRYNYHESVLRDAQTESVSSHPSRSDDVDNGDEYHSAEENDNDHNLTDNSQGNEDNVDGRRESHDGRSESHGGRNESHGGRSESHGGRNESHEQHNLIHRLNSHLPGAEEPGATNSPVDLNPWQPLSGYSSSRLHRNEHLHRALKNRKQRSSSRLRENDSNLKDALDPFSNNRTVSTNEDLTMNTSDSCQLTPISQSCVSENTPAENHKSGSYLGKRKLLDLQLETILPSKKTLIRNSSKRKWLGLSVSSESEISETEEEVVRKSHKKKRIISQSPKKSRRFDRDSRASDSDERRYEKQKCRHQSRLSCGCKSARDDADECNHGCVRRCRSQRSNISNSSKRRRQYDDDDESSNFSDYSSRREKRHKCKRHEVTEDKSEEEGDKVKTRRHYKYASKNNNDDEKRDADIACSKECQTQVSMSILGDGQNSVATNTQTGNKDSATVDTNVLSAHCHTFKMGNLGFRNSLGKVFPLKHPQMKDTGTATSDEWGNMVAVSDVQNSQVISNPRHLATTHSSPLKNNQILPAENELFSNSYVQTDKDTERPHVQLCSNNKHSVPTNLQESPFKNVVLTPSISDTFLASLPQQPTYKNLAGDIGDDNISDMEVEHSDITVNKSSQFANSQSITPSYAQSLHLKKTTAARFRHFWSEKKKNISQNLKSLFSKRNLALEKSPASPTWQIFSATLGQHVSRSSLGRAAESPSSYYRSSSVTFPLMNQMPPLTDNTSDTKMSPAANSLIEWLPSSVLSQVLNCRLAGVVNMSVSTGELTDQKTAAIVNWTDGALTHTVTSCSRTVASKAGPLMQAACNDYIGTQGHSLEAPDILTTPAGGRFDSSVQVILHAVEPSGCGGKEDKNSCVLTEVFTNCLRIARTHLGLQSISCPLIGEGTFPFVTCVQSFLDAVLAFLSEYSSHEGLFHVHLIIGDTTAAKMAANFIKSYLECVFCGNSHGQSGGELTGHKQHMRHLDVISRSRTERPPAQRFTVDRTDSGRPRLKRPRL